jgi:AbrB family looped-hinge helix DNA binding protein
MLAEMKERSQVTIPKSIVNELGLEVGDRFEVITDQGEIHLVPVVVYPKAKIKKLEELAARAEKLAGSGTATIFDNPADALASLHAGI